jgi:Mrp family chromosome partitioning ATPase
MARIIQQAAIPTSPSFPKSGPLVALITLAGLALSLGLSFLVEIMAAANRLGPPVASIANRPSESVASAAIAAPQIQEVLPLRPSAGHPSPVMDVIPAFATFPSAFLPQGNQELLRTADQPDHNGLHAASHQVADWALKLQRMAALRRLAITSMGGGGADSSMATVAIARAIASKGARVVVVDLTPDGSSVDLLFGLAEGPGFVDLLAGTTDFTKVIARDPLSSVHILRFGIERNEAALSLMDQRTDAVLSTLGNIYDIVMIHVGEATRRTLMVVAKCQAALILAPELRHRDVASAAKTLLEAGLTDVQFVRLEPSMSDEIRLAASA